MRTSWITISTLVVHTNSVLQMSSVHKWPWLEYFAMPRKHCSRISTFFFSACRSLSATNCGVPNSVSELSRTGLTTTPILLLPFPSCWNSAVAPAFSTFTNHATSAQQIHMCNPQSPNHTKCRIPKNPTLLQLHYVVTQYWRRPGSN